MPLQTHLYGFIGKGLSLGELHLSKVACVYSIGCGFFQAHLTHSNRLMILFLIWDEIFPDRPESFQVFSSFAFFFQNRKKSPRKKCQSSAYTQYMLFCEFQQENQENIILFSPLEESWPVRQPRSNSAVYKLDLKNSE